MGVADQGRAWAYGELGGPQVSGTNDVGDTGSDMVRELLWETGGSGRGSWLLANQCIPRSPNVPRNGSRINHELPSEPNAPP